MKKFTFFITVLAMSLISYASTNTAILVENATVTTEGQNILINGEWGERKVTAMLWQGGSTKGFGSYIIDDFDVILDNMTYLTKLADGIYTDNENGTFTFTTQAKDTETTYDITINGLISSGGEIEFFDRITIDNTNIMKEGVMTNFVGYNDYYEVDLVLFGQEYGEYKVVEEDGETIYPIEGFINDDMAFVGEGTYSFSEELNSDLLVVVAYLPNDGIYLEITMYTKPLVATDVLIMENMTKEIIEGRWNTNLQLSGVHETYGDVVITIAGCDGTYGEYAVTATVGDLELEGQGAWQNDGDVDVLNAMLQNADASRVFNVSVSTPYVEAPEPETIVVEVEDALFEETEDGLEITGTSLEGQELYLLVGEWAAAGYGMYTEFGAVVGTIDGVEVTIMGEDQYAGIEKDEDRAILSAVLTDGTNIYEISAYGTAPGTTTGIDNISTTVAPVKLIENGQLIIINSDIKYNAQGAVIK